MRGDPVEPVTAWQALSPIVGLVVAAAILWLVVLACIVIRGVVKRVPRSCWFGHKWTVDGVLWRCARCPEVPAPCRNCGGQHDPTAIVMCIVTRQAGR